MVLRQGGLRGSEILREEEAFATPLLLRPDPMTGLTPDEAQRESNRFFSGRLDDMLRHNRAVEDGRKPRRVFVHRIDPLLRHNHRLIGVQWIRADQRWDTVHRLRFGLWLWTFEIAWWSGRAWRSLHQNGGC